jgi:hypothetical protein
MFALALLSDKFFGTVQGQLPDVAIPSWARVLAFGAVTGFASRQLLPALSKRISNMVAEQVRDQVAPVERKAENRVQAALAQAEAVRLTAAAATPPPPVQALVDSATPQAIAQAAAAGGAAAPQWVYEIEKLLERYNGIADPDYDARVASRMDTADAMLVVLTRHAVTSAELADQVRTKTEKAWILPLATLIAARPERGDAPRLFNAYEQRLSDSAVRRESKFILYRVLLAVIALHANRRLSAAERPRAKGIALDCKEIKDSSLRKRADAVLSLFS